VRGAFFDKNTGYFLHATKDGKDALSADLKRQGHKFVEGSSLSRYRYDFDSGELVVDERPGQWDDERQQNIQEARQAFQQLKAAVDGAGTDWTNPAVVKAAFTRCVVLFRFIGRSLQ